MLVLVHPNCVHRIVFLPCSYGYAITVRKLSSTPTVRVRCDKGERLTWLCATQRKTAQRMNRAHIMALGDGRLDVVEGARSRASPEQDKRKKERGNRRRTEKQQGQREQGAGTTHASKRGRRKEEDEGEHRNTTAKAVQALLTQGEFFAEVYDDCIRIELQWLTTYRLLTKRAPLLPEMSVDQPYAVRVR